MTLVLTSVRQAYEGVMQSERVLDSCDLGYIRQIHVLDWKGRRPIIIIK